MLYLTKTQRALLNDIRQGNAKLMKEGDVLYIQGKKRTYQYRVLSALTCKGLVRYSFDSGEISLIKGDENYE